VAVDRVAQAGPGDPAGLEAPEAPEAPVVREPDRAVPVGPVADPRTSRSHLTRSAWFAPGSTRGRSR